MSSGVVPALERNLNLSPDLGSLKGPRWSLEKVMGKAKRGGHREKRAGLCPPRIQVFKPRLPVPQE